MKERLSFGISALAIGGSSVLLWSMIAAFVGFVLMPATHHGDSAKLANAAAATQAARELPAAPPVAPTTATVEPAPAAAVTAAAASHVLTEAASAASPHVDRSNVATPAPRQFLPPHIRSARSRHAQPIGPQYVAHLRQEFVTAGSGWSGGAYGPAPYSSRAGD